MMEPSVSVRCVKVSPQGVAEQRDRRVPHEVPVALVYGGSTYAVMMASPSDLEDFAVGFSLTEGVISSPDEIESLEVVEQAGGIELRMWLAAHRTRDLVDRRRRIAGPTGCGLCGVESLEAALPVHPPVTGTVAVTAADIASAMAALAPAQVLNHETHAVHGAGFWAKPCGLVAVVEDVGRHNALDKLIGRLRRSKVEATGSGMVILTSRVSVEMVQKVAVLGAPIIVAVSAPTALALQTAESAGITLVAVARADSFEVFTHAHRIQGLSSTVAEDKGKVDHAA